MTTPLADLLAQVPTLNDPAQPFTFEVKGTSIIGKWDIVRAKSLYPKEFKTIDKKYSIFGTSGFSGKTSKKEFSFELGGINKTDEGISPVLAWSFDTSRIKTPLFDFLAKNGWTQKKGLFG